MRNADGSPNTAHTTNLVHLIYVAEDAAQFRVEDGILADVAPDVAFPARPAAAGGNERAQSARIPLQRSNLE